MSNMNHGRTALVIGISEYVYAPKLKNPKNDARRLSGELESLGFQVTTVVDADQTKLMSTLREFESEKLPSSVSLFFFAGHGIQVDGQNYLLPTDANISQPSDLNFGSIGFDGVLHSFRSNSDLIICFLDACRDNPFTKTIRSFADSRAITTGRGLASIEKIRGAFVGYATDPNNVALDGSGANSPFTEALCNYIATPNLPLTELMMKVTKSVEEETNRRQSPWQQYSLTENFYFNHLEVEVPEIVDCESDSVSPVGVTGQTADERSNLTKARLLKMANSLSSHLRHKTSMYYLSVLAIFLILYFSTYSAGLRDSVADIVCLDKFFGFDGVVECRKYLNTQP